MPASISAMNIGRFLRNLSYKEQEYLYQILNTAKNFDMNEWRLLYIIVRTLWQCRHPHITLFNPLSSFDNFKYLFYNTDIFFKKGLGNIIKMIPGSKGQKSDASLLARGFLTLGPAKNMKK